ncbi:MAG TPA: isoprenylcysteine carboxylmethyltransferase family protein [Gemmatimonadales bacterium]|nr:isoprenylcysteine carboxylmethyltransferase family protein [Gemmatimonadales bacterium]
MNHGMPAYGLWSLVLINSAIFILFAFSFFKPSTKRDWQTFGSFSAFIVALFVEMYGFPLSVYLLSGWLTRGLPGVDPLNHDVGHLWYTLLGFKGNPHLNPIHILSSLVLVGGFILLSAAWRVLYKAQHEGTLATTGPYAYVRHPQYLAFIAIMFGFLLQWPTFVTLVMFPVLATVYVRLARREEREVRAQSGLAWDQYASRTPAFFPRFGRRGRTQDGAERAHA